jgi:predicted transcriptional regulator of viral defense system
MREQVVKADAKVAAIAARQHGIVTFTQLKRAGVSSSGVSRRVAGGRLHRVHRGVYAVGHRGLSREGKWTAAVLACGDGAVLSHRSAAELSEMLPRGDGPIHVTLPAPSSGRSNRRGLRIHRSSLPRSDSTVRNGIAVTTPARTIADLKRSVPAAVVRKAIREAEVNVRVAGFTVDFLWRADRLAVETDGYGAHRGRQAFEDDRERELAIGTLGIRLRRFSDRQIRTQAARVAKAVHTALQHDPG